eukprot:TRINITY_DN127_c0_g2_i1.p1 TRINITY_DN127_c0_g2~~TRINITY_DN127_c0_g2_i1.p1  ORF type:complete len:555 (-),score=153.82 TRINITY_DN127_c0_g2_i1:7-1671(-)
MENNEDVPEDIKNIEEQMKKDKQNKIIINDKNLEYVDADPEIFQKTRILMWQADYDGAEELVKSYSSKNIWVQSLIAEIYFWKLIFGESEETKKNCEYNMNLYEALSKAMKKKFKNGANMSQNDSELQHYFDAMIGDAYSLTVFAIYYFTTRSPVKGGYYLRKGWKLWEKVKQFEEKIVKKFGSEALPESKRGFIAFGIGFYHFVMSLVPPRFAWLIKLLGFKGDRDTAISQLETASNLQNIKTEECKLLMVALKWFFTDEREEACNLLDKLHENCPQSIVLYFVSGWMETIRENLPGSLDYYKRVVDSDCKIPQLKASAKYHLAYSHWLNCDWEKAKVLISQYLKESLSKRAYCYSNYLLGTSMWMLNEDPNEIAKVFKVSLETQEKDDNWDKYAVRIATVFINSGNKFGPIFTNLFKMDNLAQSARFKECLEIALNIKDQILSLKVPHKDPEALWNYHAGRAYKGLKQYDEALKCFQQCVSLNKQLLAEKQVVPYSYNSIGEIEMEKGNFTVANDNWKKAESFKNFDFDRLLSFRLKSNYEILKSKIKRSKN